MKGGEDLWQQKKKGGNIARIGSCLKSSARILKKLKRPHLDYFKGFYADTALFGSVSGTQCGLDFFGVDQILFASDSPFDPEKGPGYIRETIRLIDELPISDEDRMKIYEGNTRRLLKL